jgi:hypothetical protein
VKGVTLVRSDERPTAGSERSDPVTLLGTLRGMFARAAGKLIP